MLLSQVRYTDSFFSLNCYLKNDTLVLFTKEASAVTDELHCETPRFLFLFAILSVREFVTRDEFVDFKQCYFRRLYVTSPFF